jgi:GntR family transcriptional regulator
MYSRYNKEVTAVAIWVDFESPIPIYQQIRTSIIKAISSGELNSGDVLPSIRQLGIDLGVNMHTVAKAYSLLKNDGYLIMDEEALQRLLQISL